MPNLKPTELIILLVVLVLLFGAKKLPDAARGIGRSLRIFKAEVKAQDNVEIEDNNNDNNTDSKS
jgi:sec-independent protein translocase protein TatA